VWPHFDAVFTITSTLPDQVESDRDGHGRRITRRGARGKH
jgi:hypothetical protein